MARKSRNDSYLSSFIKLTQDNSGIQEDHNITKVKIPYFFTVSIQVKAGIYTSGKDKGKPIYATQDIISKEPFPKEWIIQNCVPVTLQFTNKCPKCENIGTPRIDKKGMGVYHMHTHVSHQDEQYRLIYFHKQEDSKIKPCVIAKFGKQGIFTKTGRISKIVEDYIFPNYIIKNI